MSFHWFDIAAGVFLLGCVIYSSLRGFVKDLFSMLAWVIGYFGSISIHPYATPYTKQVIKTGLIADLVTFFLLFALLYIFVRLLGVLSQKKLGLQHIPSEIDHGAGAILGFAKWAFFLAIFLSPLNHFPELKRDLSENSFMASIILNATTQFSASDGTGLEPGNGFEIPLLAVDREKVSPGPESGNEGGEPTTGRTSPVNKVEKGGADSESGKQFKVKEIEPIIKATTDVKENKIEPGDNPNGMDDFIKSFKN